MSTLHYKDGYQLLMVIYNNQMAMKRRDNSAEKIMSGSIDPTHPISSFRPLTSFYYIIINIIYYNICYITYYSIFI